MEQAIQGFMEIISCGNFCSPAPVDKLKILLRTKSIGFEAICQILKK